MYIFKIHRAYGTTDERFASAVDCARTSIESVLYDLDAAVSVEGCEISIAVSGITASECNKRIQGCFRNREGAFYKEFLSIELLSQKA